MGRPWLKTRSEIDERLTNAQPCRERLTHAMARNCNGSAQRVWPDRLNGSRRENSAARSLKMVGGERRGWREGPSPQETFVTLSDCPRPAPRPQPTSGNLSMIFSN